jgi:hypothetical protein
MRHNKAALGLALCPALVGRMGVAGMGNLESARIYRGLGVESTAFDEAGALFHRQARSIVKVAFPLPAPDEQKVLCLECGRLRDLARTAFDMALSLNDLEYAWRRELLIVALVESNLNCEDAAHMLGVHRNTITRMMREAGIRINRQHHVLEEACLDF